MRRKMVTIFCLYLRNIGLGGTKNNLFNRSKVAKVNINYVSQFNQTYAKKFCKFRV